MATSFPSFLCAVCLPSAGNLVGSSVGIVSPQPLSSLGSSQSSVFGRRQVQYLANVPCSSQSFQVKREFVCVATIAQPSVSAKKIPEAPALRVLLASIGFNAQKIDQILLKYPRLVKIDAEATAKPAVDYLIGVEGFMERDIRNMIAEHPVLLGFNVEKRLAPVIQHLRSVGLKTGDLVRLLQKYPAALDMNVEIGLRPVLDLLQAFGLKDSAISGLLPARAEMLLRLDPVHLQQTLEFLVNEVGFGPDQVEQLLWRDGWVLKRPVNKLRAVSDLIEGLGVSCSHRAYVLTKCPDIFGFGADALAGKLRFLRNKGLTEEQLGEMIHKFPPFLTFDLHNVLRPKIMFLQRVGVGGGDLCAFLHKCPSFFGMDLEREAAPKLQYLLRTIGKKIRDLVEHPQPYMQAKLQKTIKPRHQYVLHKNADIVQLNLKDLFGTTDEEFVALVGGSVQEFRAFAASL